MEKKTPATTERESNVAKELSRSVDAFGRTLDRLSSDQDRTEQRLLDLNSRLEATNTHLRQTLQDYGAELELLRSVVECSDAGVIGVDGGGRVRVYNSAAERVLGWTSVDVLGRLYHDVWPDGEGSVDSALLALNRGEGARHERIEKVRSDGHRVVVRSVTATWQGGPDRDRAVGAAETFTPVAVEPSAGDDDEQMRMLASLGEMAATVAHEIRSPLAGIGGFADLLLRDLDDADPCRRHAERIVTGVENLGRLVTRLLEFASDPKPEWQPIEWTSFVRSILASFEEEWEREGIRLRLVRRLPEGLGTGRGDTVFLQQVVGNLVRNAQQALESKDNGVVTLSASRLPDGGLELTVADNGGGIPEEIQSEVFRPFFTTRRKGTGLGLATCRKIVEAHGGSIRLKSSLNSGTSVTLKLPGAPESE